MRCGGLRARFQKTRLRFDLLKGIATALARIFATVAMPAIRLFKETIVQTEFKGHGTALDSDGLAAALDVLKVGASELWAVLAVETSGVGFFTDRRPKILYERHVFSRLTNHEFDADHPDISSRTPGNYGPTGAHQYDRLDAAIALNRDAALQSTSWGLGQTMGFNFKQTQSTSAENMAQRMSVSESEQLLCAAGEMAAGGAISALRARDWTNFARIYNGANFAINNYDARLRAAYQSYAFGGTPDLRVRAAQNDLTFLGFAPGQVDGVLGNRTRDAMNLFQAKQKLPTTTVLDDATFERLQAVVGALPV